MTERMLRERRQKDAEEEQEDGQDDGCGQGLTRHFSHLR